MNRAGTGTNKLCREFCISCALVVGVTGKPIVKIMARVKNKNVKKPMRIDFFATVMPNCSVKISWHKNMDENTMVPKAMVLS